MIKMIMVIRCVECGEQATVEVGPDGVVETTMDHEEDCKGLLRFKVGGKEPQLEAQVFTDTKAMDPRFVN